MSHHERAAATVRHRHAGTAPILNAIAMRRLIDAVNKTSDALMMMAFRGDLSIDTSGIPETGKDWFKRAQLRNPH